MPIHALQRRKGIRFKPDQGTQGFIWFSGTQKEPEVALVINEAHKGCGLVLATPPKLEIGQYIRVKIGQFLETPAEIRWIKPLDGEVVKIGVKYLR